MHGVFISYSRVDGREVGAVAEELRLRGVQVWMDQSDIPQGVPWERQLRRAIRECDLVASFVSDAWLASVACASERETAQEYGKDTVDIDVAGPRFTVKGAADDIVRAISQLDPRVAVKTELEVAAAGWTESGRSRKHVATGSQLTTYRRLLDGDLSVTATAREFVVSSTRAFRWRRFDLGLGLVVLALAGLMVVVFPRAIEKSTTARAELVTTLNEYAVVQSASERGPYSALAAALELPADEKRYRSHSYVSTLLDAVSVDVPIERAPAGSEGLEEFTFASADSTRNHDGSRIAEISPGDQRVVISDPRTTGGAVVAVTVPGKAENVLFSPDGSVLAVLSDEAVSLVDPVRGRVWRTLTGADLSDASGLAWSDDSRQLAVRESPTGSVDVWQVLSGTEVLARTGLWIMDSTSLGTTGRMAFLGRDSSLALVDLSGSVTTVRDAFPSGVASSVASLPDGESVVAIVRTSGSSGLYRYDLIERRSSTISIPKGCEPTTVATSTYAGGRIAVACGSRLVLLDTDGKVVGDATTQIALISTIAMTREGHVFAGADGGGAVVAFDSHLDVEEVKGNDVPGASQDVGFRPGATPRRIRVAPDGDVVFSVGDGTGFNSGARVFRSVGDRTWEMGTPPVWSAGATQSRGLAISPDGRWAAIGLSDGTVQVLEASTAATGWRWNELEGEVRGVEFTADSNSIIFGTRDGLIARVPAMTDSVDGKHLRELAQTMLDRAQRLGLYAP